MNIHDYWSLSPTAQAAMRAAVLTAGPDRRPTPAAGTTCTPPPHRLHEATYKILYARDLLHGLGDVDGVDERSDADCIEAAEVLGFRWTGTSWVPE